MTEVGSDQKRLFDIVNKVQKKSKSNPLPDHKLQEVLANDLASFFKGKIDKSVESFTPDDSFNLENTRDVPQFSAFTPLTLEKTVKLITASANKTCSLDPIPTCLVKACAVELSPVIMKIINLSMDQGCMPKVFKSAVVTPLLKNQD